MPVTVGLASISRPPVSLIAGFRNAPVAVISDNLARLPGSVGLRPFHRGRKMVGTALTIRTRGGDNLAIHHALEII
jgi:regulator of RNase E activity RraA